MKTRRASLKFYLITVLFFSLMTDAICQEGEKLGSWYIYNGFFNFSPKFELFAETQLRTWETLSNAQTFFVRPFFNYNINKNLQAGISQEYHVSWSYAEPPDSKIKSEEYRTTLQGMITHKANRISFQHRLRYEFRFLDESGKQRTRYRLQLGVPISDNTLKKGVWFATLGNEIMLNTKPNFDVSQNRAYGMLGYQFSETTNLQFGYMNIYRPVEENLHRLQFFLTQKFKFYD